MAEVGIAVPDGDVVVAQFRGSQWEIRDWEEEPQLAQSGCHLWALGKAFRGRKDIDI